MFLHGTLIWKKLVPSIIGDTWHRTALHIMIGHSPHGSHFVITLETQLPWKPFCDCPRDGTNPLVVMPINIVHVWPSMGISDPDSVLFAWVCGFCC